ncbi:helix-turn-helix domain-containing protein [Streptomyces lavendulae]|uniref:helix-turn-helix domain-containing protein n=1 Tax=Streptomyces lavendulae TaxID=1914 RepID=UPI0036F12EDE
MTYRLRTERLRAAAREAGDQSNTAIAQRTGISQSALSRMLRGQSRPLFETILRISRTYGLSHEDLVEDTTEVAA